MSDRSPNGAGRDCARDLQTVPTSAMVNQSVGYDGNKIKGRKRFALVDTLGLLIMVRVQGDFAQSVTERDAKHYQSLSETMAHLRRIWKRSLLSCQRSEREGVRQLL